MAHVPYDRKIPYEESFEATAILIFHQYSILNFLSQARHFLRQFDKGFFRSHCIIEAGVYLINN